MRTHIYVLMLTCSVFSMQAMLWSGPARLMVISALRTHTQQRLISSSVATTYHRKIAAPFDIPYGRKSSAQHELELATKALAIFKKVDDFNYYRGSARNVTARELLEDRVRRAEEALSKEK